jgi:tRNA pseudouridine38-40 synthase
MSDIPPAPDDTRAPTQRYAMGIEYDGSQFSGWQRLSKRGESDPEGYATLQSAIEEALSFVAGTPIETICAGRTDAGVHAAGQVIHFDSPVLRDPRGWVLGTTSKLPPAIGALWCVPVNDGFHARFSARARRYRYSILNRMVRPALNRQQASDNVAHHVVPRRRYSVKTTSPPSAPCIAKPRTRAATCRKSPSRVMATW